MWSTRVSSENRFCGTRIRIIWMVVMLLTYIYMMLTMHGSSIEYVPYFLLLLKWFISTSSPSKMSSYPQNNFDLNTAPQEQILLALRSDSDVVNDSLVASMQHAASVTNLGQRLLARSQEVQALRSQVIILRRRLTEANQKLRRLEKSNKDLEELVSVLQVHEENEGHQDSPTDAQI